MLQISYLTAPVQQRERTSWFSCRISIFPNLSQCRINHWRKKKYSWFRRSFYINNILICRFTKLVFFLSFPVFFLIFSYIWDIMSNPVTVSIHANFVVRMFVQGTPPTGRAPVIVVPALPAILGRGQTKCKDCKEHLQSGHGVVQVWLSRDQWLPWKDRGSFILKCSEMR